MNSFLNTFTVGSSIITNLISVKIAFDGSPRVIHSFTASNITFALISFGMPKSTDLIAGKAMDLHFLLLAAAARLFKQAIFRALLHFSSSDLFHIGTTVWMIFLHGSLPGSVTAAKLSPRLTGLPSPTDRASHPGAGYLTYLRSPTFM